MSTLARSNEPGWEEHFEDRRSHQPYMAVYSAVLPLVRAVGAEAAGRWILTFCVVLLPISLAAVLQALRPRAVIAALLAIPLTYSDIYLMGFLNYLLSLPLLFFAIALGLVVLEGNRRAGTAAVGLCLCLILACHAHPVSFALFGLLAVSWLLWRAASLRALVLIGIASLPAALAFVTWFAGYGSETSWRVPAGYKLTYLLSTPGFLLDAGGAAEAPWVLAGFGVLAVGAVIAAMRSESLRVPRLGSPWGGFLAVLALYWVLPFARDSVIWADLRLAIVVWLMAIVCAASALVSQRWMVAVAASTALIYIVGAARVHHAYALEAAPLFALLDALPDDQRILPILLAAKSEAIQPSHQNQRVVPYASPYTHFASWYHLEKRGESPYMAFHHSMPMIPVALRSLFYRHKFPVGGVFAPGQLLARLPSLAPKFDYILVRSGSLHGVAAIEEVATLRSEAPPFYAFEVRR